MDTDEKKTSGVTEGTNFLAVNEAIDSLYSLHLRSVENLRPGRRREAWSWALAILMAKKVVDKNVVVYGKLISPCD